ncbi:MAG TPA: type II toxin-antitoxin system HipA family toxin [Steroidobacteraceae bacterium]|jgi:serine/threonine-protein kinase HipA|nr:type II toxin-antitoxin system HipA family toxin [Steroidobacteraceae bacterium]
MPRPSTALAVWANGIRVGLWRLPARGATEFQYDDAWRDAAAARPLSLSLPLTLKAHAHKGAAVEAYFDNLLPDSEPIRRRLQERFHTASRGAFDLLSAIGRDCVGAVQLLAPDATPTDVHRIEATALNEAAIARELGAVTSPNNLRGDNEDFRISIAGAQEKTAFLRHNGRWCLPQGSTPTSHIFKLPLGLVGNRQADMRTSVENEWLCARIVAAFGIPVAHCEIGQFGEHKALIVERFDRQLHSGGKYWLRLVQEDFCQATGTPWHRKYQADGGPGLIAIARILRNSQESQRDLTTLFRAQLLFWMLAATDGHAKNFSIRILQGGVFHLTPLYDVLSAWPIIGKKANEISPQKIKLAMAMPGQRPHYLLQSIQRRHFEELAKRLGLNAEAERLIGEMAEKTPAVIDEVQRGLPKGFPQGTLDRVLHGLAKSAQLLIRG